MSNEGNFENNVIPTVNWAERQVYKYNDATIDQVITEKKPGNYLLFSGGSVKYIGRSDGDLATELKSKRYAPHIKQTTRESFDSFKFCYARNARTAYRRECKDYHTYLDQDIANKEHPCCPEGDRYQYCPYDGCEKYNFSGEAAEVMYGETMN